MALASWEMTIDTLSYITILEITKSMNQSPETRVNLGHAFHLQRVTQPRDFPLRDLFDLWLPATYLKLHFPTSHCTSQYCLT